MLITPSQFQEMTARLERNCGRAPKPAPEDAEPLELPLHEKIIAYCDAQWPHWKYIHARTDEKSTIAEGCQDFTLFLPQRRTVCIECKSATGKASKKQLIWRAEMLMLGFTVHEVRSMAQFMELVK